MTGVLYLLLDTIAARIQTGVHRTTIVCRGALQVHRARRIEARLRHRPLVTFEAIGRGLLLALAVAWIHIDISSAAPVAPRPRRRRAVGTRRRRRGVRLWRRDVVRRRRIASLRNIARRRFIRATLHHRRGIRRYVAVLARVPVVVCIVVVVVRQAAPVVRGVTEREHREEPGKARTVVGARPESATPVTTTPEAARTAYEARMTIPRAPSDITTART